MKKHEAAILAAIGGVGLYLFIVHKPFRKAVFQACHEYVKAAEERLDKPTISTVFTVGKKGSDKRKKRNRSEK